MSEIIVNISPEKEGLVKEFVENLGGTVIVQKKEKGKTKKEVSVKKKSAKTISPTFLFGMWKDFDIDARKLRQEVWERKF